MELRLLRYFIAVAEERHFGRAARRLHISQPPLSYAIRQLEEQLGVRLLERNSRHVALTPAGHMLYGQALALLRQAEEISLQVRRVDAGLQGRCRIGFVGSMLYRGLPDILGQLRQQLPGVEQVLQERNSHDQIEAIQRGELDLGFVHANPLPPEVRSLDLMAEPFVVCLPQAHPLAARRKLDLPELAREDFIFFAREASPSYYETVLSLCVAAGFHPAVRHEVRHWLSVCSLVSQGLGVSIVPACMARSRLAGTRFLAFDHAARSRCQLIWSARDALPLAERTLAIVRQHFAGQGEP